MSKNHEGNNANGQQSESFFKRKPRDGNNQYFAGAHSHFRSSGENGPAENERSNPSQNQHHFLYSASGNGQVPMYPSFHNPSQGMMVSVPGQFVYPGVYPSPSQSLPGQYNGPNPGIPAGGIVMPSNAGYYQGQNVIAVGPNSAQGMPAVPANDGRNPQLSRGAPQPVPSNTQFDQHGPSHMTGHPHHVDRAQSTAGTNVQPSNQGPPPSFSSRDNREAPTQPPRNDRHPTLHHGHSSSKSIISASQGSNQNTPSSSMSTVPSPVPFVPSPTPVAVMPAPSPKQMPSHQPYPSNQHGHQQAQLQYSTNQPNTSAMHPVQQQTRGFSPVSAPSEGKQLSPHSVQNLQNAPWPQQQTVHAGNAVPPSPSMSAGGQQTHGWNAATAPASASSGSAPHAQQQVYHYPPLNNASNVKVTGHQQGTHETSPTIMTMLPPAAVAGSGSTNDFGRHPLHHPSHPSYPQPPQAHFGYQPTYQQPSVSMIHPMEAAMHQQMMMYNATAVPMPSPQLNPYASPHSVPVPPHMSVSMPYMMVDGHNHMVMPQMYAAYNPSVPGGSYPVAPTVSPQSQFVVANDVPNADQKGNRNQHHQQQHPHSGHYHSSHHNKPRNAVHDGGQRS